MSPSTPSDTVTRQIDQAIAGLDGTLEPRDSFIDTLLDLRAAVSDDPIMLLLIDELLSAVPGVTVVEAAWARETLGALRDQVGDDAVAV